ncbi:MAG: IclR family transcriptional regulator [Nitriliruptoraceae bacterium]|nr:IclR family transcriptional regulator [Nitriliruptoraceae bacterium]
MRGSVPAARRAMAVLRVLARHPRPVAAATIARELELPRSSTYHLLAALQDEGFVVYLPEERRYGLGLAAFELGSAYLRQDGLERLGRPVLRRLVADTGAVGHLGVLDGRETLYLAKEQPPEAELLVTEVGVRLPAHLTASGRCLLAHLPAAQLSALFPGGRELGRRTDRGPGSPSQLRTRLAEERARGWSMEDGEISEGFVSIAAAGFDHTGRPVASLGLTVRERTVDRAALEGLADAVQQAAATLTIRLDGSPPGGSPPRAGPPVP